MTEIKKYELVMDDTVDIVFIESKKAYRIRALRDFGDVKAGDLGGYIESEKNLSHDGKCWVGGEAKVTGRARVRFNAQVYGKATVNGSAMVEGRAQVYGSAIISERAKIRNSAKVHGNAKVFGNAVVTDHAEVYDDGEVFMSATVDDHAKIIGDSDIYGNCWVGGEAEISGYANIFGSSRVYDKAKVSAMAEVSGTADISDNALVCGSAKIATGSIAGKSQVFGDIEITTDVHFNKKAEVASKSDYMLFDCVGSEDGILTAFKTRKKGVCITRGCFSGTIKKFKKTVESVHSENPKVLEEYRTIIKLIENRLGEGK